MEHPTVERRSPDSRARDITKGKRLRSLLPANLVRSGSPAALRFGGALLQFVATLLIARVLGAARSGDFFFWSSIFRFTGQTSTFGLDRIALRQVPRLRDSPAAVPRFAAPLRITALLFSVLAAGLVVGYAIFVNPAPSRPLWWYLLPPACIVGVALCMINAEIMNGSGRPVLGVIYRHTLPTAAFVIALVIAVRFASPDLLLLLFTVTFMGAGFGALLGPGFRGEAPHFRLPGASEFLEHLRLGSPVFLCSLLTALTYMVPLGILEWNHPSEQVAYFTTAYRLFLLFEVLSTAVHTLAMPSLSKAAEAGDIRRLRGIYGSSLAKGLLLLGPAMILCLALARPVMGIFGEGFDEAGPILRHLLLFGVLSLACGPAPFLVLMVGRTGRMAMYAFSRFAIAVVLAVLLVPDHGSTGMALALGTGLLLEKGLSLLHLRGLPPAARISH